MPKTKISESFVLAAGLGTRMRPITDTIPKPLVKVAGQTMLDHALSALHKAGVDHAVVNVHYLADQIETHVENYTNPRVSISDERAALLDSGGGVKRGLKLLNDDVFFVLNADTFWRDEAGSNLDAMRELWNEADMDILLLLADKKAAVGFDGGGVPFSRDAQGRLTPHGTKTDMLYDYAGAFIIKSSLFDAVEEDIFSLRLLFFQAASRGRLFGHVLQGLWLHVGTPQAIGEAEAALLAFDAKRNGAA